MYLKINNTDYSSYVNGLYIDHVKNFSSLTNAAGNTVIDYINTKRKIEVGIIAVNDTVMQGLVTLLANTNLTISFLDPATKAMSSNVSVYVEDYAVEYYTIQSNNVSFNEFTITFKEL